ncbi:MAG: leucine-rich repeat protein [Bacilli bacterium]|nr:leucine-rich repeat protein [Bacilli bacterium]
MNDFRGDPSLQTIVIPNLYTNVRVQKLAFQGSSRAVMYFSGSEEKGIMANDAAQDEKTGGGQWTKLIGTEFGSADGDSSDLSKATQWNKIGDETCFSSEQVDYKGFLGYAFVPQEVVDGTTTIVPGAFTNKGATYSGDTSSQRSTFDLDQNIKAYWNVHYKEVLKDVDDKDVIVEVGDSNSVNMFTIDQESKCAYLCCPAHDDVRKHAIMTKYLYDLRDKRSDHDVATVKGSVKPLIIGSDNYFNAEEYTVDEIGDSAFSAAFCDGTDGTASGFKDLQKVVVPDSIARIGDYAFLRAYGVKEFGTESGSMPSSLRSIGKNAFTFCNIKQFLDIPYECVFYENTSAAATNYKVCSVFSNNFSLRKISFRNSAGETGKPSSKHYTTATYTSAGDGTPTYTTSLYSASSEAGFGKNNRLLLILYRDESDRERADGTIVTTNNHSVLFDGKRTDGEEPFLYGAYRMGYWIDELEIGPATKDGSNSVLPQPLFSGICRRVVDDSGAQRTVTVTDQYIYLHQPIPGYEDNACDLKVVTGDSLLVAPAFGLCGCESLTSVVLPQVSEKKVPDGLFVGTGENCLFKTENNTADATHLDFVNSGISGIGSSSFKGNQSIEKITFQRDDNKGFVIGENAFEGCTNLEELDFSQVTGTLTIKKGAFKGCTNLTAITWPENGTVDLNDGGDKDFVSDGIFEGCTSLTSVSLPKNKSDKKTIGKYCFKGCTNLSSVTGATGNTYTTVGESAFLNCSSLSDFAFGDFSALTTISANAFNGAGEISLDGNVSFPKTLVEFGNNCFSNSSIVTITFNGESSDLLNLGTGAFYNADNLEAVYFAHSDAGLKSTSDYNVNVFGSCENLVELQLPNTFPISETKDKYFIEGSNDVVIYLAHKAYDATFNSSNKTWFKPTASSSAQVYWLVDEFSDLVSDGEWRYSGAVGLEKNNFWTRDSSGHAVKLGKATSEQTSGSITTVAFTEGQTLTESGGFSPAIESITTVPYRDGALERTLG